MKRRTAVIEPGYPGRKANMIKAVHTGRRGLRQGVTFTIRRDENHVTHLYYKGEEVFMSVVISPERLQDVIDLHSNAEEKANSFYSPLCFRDTKSEYLRSHGVNVTEGRIVDRLLGRVGRHA